MSKKIAIIGAGLSGSVLYKNLKKQNHKITIFEKSRGAGGRCSTRYIDDLKIDHGTSSFQVCEQAFKSFCDKQVQSKILFKEENHYKGTHGINQMVSSSISANDVVSRTRIIKAYKKDSKWILEDENKNIYTDFDILLCTIPTFQVLDLKIKEIEHIKPELQNVTYDAVATLIVYGAAFDEEQIEKLEKNSFFRKISVQKDGIVFHTIAKISNELDSKKQVEDIIIEEIRATLGIDILETMSVLPHLWRYGFVKNSLDIDYLYDEKLRFGLCGDYFKGKNLESSFLSSSSLANKIS